MAFTAFPRNAFLTGILPPQAKRKLQVEKRGKLEEYRAYPGNIGALHVPFRAGR